MTHIAVDIGASSGRLVIGDIKNGKLTIEEIHRFANGFTERNGTYYWDIDHLLTEIVKGLAYAKTLGVKKVYTWNRYLGYRLCAGRSRRKKGARGHSIQR